MQMKKNTKSPKAKSVGGFGLTDLLVIIIFLFIAAVSINLFRMDLLRTINLRNVEPVGTVVVRRNVVQRRLADRVLWDRLASESPVYLGDLIRVAELSSAILHIDGSSISLNENTLIRLTRAPDGETLQIMMSEGSLSLATTRNSGRLSLDVNGMQVQLTANPPPGDSAAEESEAEWVPAVIDVTSTEEGITLQVNEGTALFFEEGRTYEVAAGNRLVLDTAGFVYEEEAPPLPYVPVTRIIPEVRLQSPADGSVFRFSDAPQVMPQAVRFQWGEVSDAYSYVLEVCNTPYFTTPQITRESRVTFFAQPWFEDENLKTGKWYWRVMPVFPSVYTVNTSFSQVSSFHVEQPAAAPVTETLTFSQWLAEEVTTVGITSVEITPAGIYSDVIYPEPIVEIVPPPAPVRPTALQPLPAPGNLQPARGHRITMNELQTRRNLNFSWQQVSGANAYIITFYHQTETGRQQVFQTQPISRASYLLEDLRFLDSGTFFWRVEAVTIRADGTIDRRGDFAESSFVMDIVLPGAVQIEGTRELDEN
jgi:hypothetical protein